MKSESNYPRGRSTAERLEVELQDGRLNITPLEWYPRLDRATSAQREAWVWLGDGVGISWDEIDEDLSIQGMLDGNPARAYQQSKQAAAHA
jgi:hypothetical protein